MQIDKSTSIAIIDVETTGTSPARDRIIEVGIVRVDGENVQTFETLINPDRPVGPMVFALTGINSVMVEDAPRFEDVALLIQECIGDALIIAHNVRFDISFLTEEFKRLGIPLKNSYACSMRLSQTLYPRNRRHNLDRIMVRHGLACESRHRALPDAVVVHEFMQSARRELGDEAVFAALTGLVKTRRLPPMLAEETVQRLPDGPGVYLFYAKDDTLLYVGKSRHIRTRVRSHFSGETESGTKLSMLSEIARIETIETAGEIGALLLESHLIKTRQPVYNRIGRARSMLCLAREHTDENGYNRVSIEHATPGEVGNLDNILSIYKTKRQAKESLASIAKNHKLCPHLMGLEAGVPCFAKGIGQCDGACVGKEKKRSYNRRFREAFAERAVKTWPFPGAMVVEEKAGPERSDAFIIDGWKVVGAYTSTPEGVHELLPVSAHFEYDTYKILAGHLLRRKPRPGVVVRPAPQNETESLIDSSGEIVIQ